MISHDELEQVRAINRALPFMEGIAQGNTLRRDHLEAMFMNDAKSLQAFRKRRIGGRAYYALMDEYDALT